LTVTIDKKEYITELEQALEHFYEAKAVGDKEQIKYFQGYSKGIIEIMKKLEIVNDEELKDIVNNIELDFPSIFRSKTTK